MNIIAKVNKYDGDYGLKGFVDIVIDGMFVVNGITIRESQSGNLYCSMPQKKVKPFKDKDGNEREYQDVFHPISGEARQMLFDVILEEYNNSDNKPKKKNKTTSDSDDDSFPF